jgi:hypothetical protein
VRFVGVKIETCTIVQLSGLLVVGLLSAIVVACGSARVERSTSSLATPTTVTSAVAARSTTAAALSRKRSDRDGDSDNNDDDYGYGHPATAQDEKTIENLVKEYYAAAAAGDGVTACSLIYSLLAEEIPELYGEPPGPPSLRGATCSVVMSKLFSQHHRDLKNDFATFRVLAVRVKRLRALVILRFKDMPQRDVLVHREHRVWKVDGLLDTDLG